MIHVSKTAVLALVLTASAGFAETRYKLNGGFSYLDPSATSIEAGMGYDTLSTFGGGLRVMHDGAEGELRFETHLNLVTQIGDAVSLAKLLPATPTPPATLFDMSESFDLGTEGTLTAVIDRANISYTTDQTVLKLGRQAITWGQGTVFHPGDLVAPFSPLAIDTSYKTGVDMVYGQYLFDNGADIQAIYVPRAATAGGAIDRDSSTFAMRGFTTIGATDLTLTLAEDRGDRAVALGFSGALGALGVKGEIVDWSLASGTAEPSWVLSAMGFGSLGEWSTTYFAEIYHNGFGVSASTPMDALPAPLMKKMAAGHVFYPGKDFIALGGSIAPSPELSLAPSAIISFEDRSALLGLSGNYVLGDNADLSFALFAPVGADGTDFGGRETSAGSGVYMGASPSVSIVATQYF